MMPEPANEYDIGMILCNQVLILRALSFLVDNTSSEVREFADTLAGQAEASAAIAEKRAARKREREAVAE